MSIPQALALTPLEATDWLRRELFQARISLQASNLDIALDAYVRALGVALQLGPAPTEQVLSSVLEAARDMACRQDAAGLSALGPALVDLVAQVLQTDALPQTRIMNAWATVASDLGVIVGQVGLALIITPDRRSGMLNKARTRAALLDRATDCLFALHDWIDRIDIDSNKENC